MLGLCSDGQSAENKQRPDNPLCFLCYSWALLHSIGTSGGVAVGRRAIRRSTGNDVVATISAIILQSVPVRHSTGNDDVMATISVVIFISFSFFSLFPIFFLFLRRDLFS